MTLRELMIYMKGDDESETQGTPMTWKEHIRHVAEDRQARGVE